MSGLLAALLVVVTVELLYRLPVVDHFKKLTRCIYKAGRVMRSPAISDHWKERALLMYARQIFTTSLMSLLWLVASFAPLVALTLAGASQGIAVDALLLSFEGIIGCILMAVVYQRIRPKLGG